MIHQAVHQVVQVHFQEYSKQISKLQPVYLAPQLADHATKLPQTSITVQQFLLHSVKSYKETTTYFFIFYNVK
jgi:hypothetical protein